MSSSNAGDREDHRPDGADWRWSRSETSRHSGFIMFQPLFIPLLFQLGNIYFILQWFESY